MSEITDLPSDWRDNEEPVPSPKRRERVVKLYNDAYKQHGDCDFDFDADDMKDHFWSFIAALDAEADARVRETEREFGAILERERTTVADSVNLMKKALQSRRWLYNGERGSYAWDDRQYLSEFKGAVDEIETAIEPLMSLARDLDRCPKTTAEVIAARQPADARVEAMREACQTAYVELYDWITKKVSEATYNAEELGQGINAWRELADSKHNGTLASFENAVSALSTKGSPT